MMINVATPTVNSQPLVRSLLGLEERKERRKELSPALFFTCQSARPVEHLAVVVGSLLSVSALLAVRQQRMPTKMSTFFTNITRLYRCRKKNAGKRETVAVFSTAPPPALCCQPTHLTC
jgi:hypothetical protein